MSKSDLTPVPIDKENLESVLRLGVSPDQERFVAGNAVSIAQGSFTDGAAMHCLLRHGEAVGFYSLIDPRHATGDLDEFQPECGHLWRFMIDQSFQGQGLGGHALALIFDSVLADGLEGLSLTAVDNFPGSPVGFYEKNGFARTGRVLDGEVELVKRRDP